MVYFSISSVCISETRDCCVKQSLLIGFSPEWMQVEKVIEDFQGYRPSDELHLIPAVCFL